MYKILLADQDKRVLNFLQEEIEVNFPNQCVFKLANKGNQAVLFLESFIPNIVFIDVSLLGTDSIEAIMEIKKLCPNTFFIILAGNQDIMNAYGMMYFGADELLLKPIRKEELLTVLSRVFQKQNQKIINWRTGAFINEKVENKKNNNNLNVRYKNNLIYTILFH